MSWTIKERAEAFDREQTAGKGPALAPSKGFTDNLSAERRVKDWQKELRETRAKG